MSANPPRIRRKFAETNLWYEFLLSTRKADKKDSKDRGWNWFWAIYYLHTKIPEFPKVDFQTIQNTLPDGHWLKDVKNVDPDLSRSSDRDMMKEQTAREAPSVSLSILLKSRKTRKKITQIDFSKLKFKDDADFSDIVLPVTTSFKYTKFFNEAIFDNAKFLDYTSFSNVEFSKTSYFKKTQFYAKVDFDDTQFLDNIFFEKAIFCETVNFENAKFHEADGSHRKTAKFKDAIFTKTADFSKAFFGAYANFKGATFSGRTIFQQAEFKYHAPRFYETTFNNEIILNRIELPTAKRDELHEIIIDDRNRDDTENDILQKTVEENKSAYETLIHLMEKQNKHHDQHRFFREEMRWRQVGNILTKERRRIETQKWCATQHRSCYCCMFKLLECFMACLRKLFRIKARQQNTDDTNNYLTKKYSLLLWLEDNFIIAFFCLYEKIADYGYGIGRAFGWWLGHIIVGIGFIGLMVLGSLLWGCWQGAELSLWQSLSCSIPVSFANANPFAFIGADKGSLMDCYDQMEKISPVFFGIIRAVQTVFGIILLFLLLTTLRVRFRLK